MDPVEANCKAIEKGFVNRTKERARAKDFVDLPGGKLLVFGSIGERKSSFLNLLEFKAKKAGWTNEKSEKHSG
jgi:hypothetical protein